MKKSYFWLLVVLLFVNVVSIKAQETEAKIVQEERIPIVNGGLKLQGNASNFLLNLPVNLDLRSSSMNGGLEVGGFVDFNVARHFLIQLNLMMVSEHCDLHYTNSKDKMLTLGLEVPVYFLGRYGNGCAGYVYFGGGPFTEFNLCNFTQSSSAQSLSQRSSEVVDLSKVARTFVNNYSGGLAVYVGYELPCRLQFNASYLFGISSNMLQNDSYARTQKVTFGLAYRFK